MSTHNLCFHRGIRKIICGYPLLSGDMVRDISLYCTQKSIHVLGHLGQLKGVFSRKVGEKIGKLYVYSQIFSGGLFEPVFIASFFVFFCFFLIEDLT